MPIPFINPAFSKSLKGFLIKLLLFTGTVVVLDQITGYLLKKSYHSQVSGPEYRTKFSLEGTTAKTIILGSSRAEWIISPKQFEDSLQTTCWNAGRNGHPIFYHEAVLEAILKRYTPERVIFCMDALAFSKFEEAYDRIATLLPYYESHPEIRKIIRLKGTWEPLKLYAATYPYNSMILPVLSGHKKENPKDEGIYNGFKPLTDRVGGLPEKRDYLKDRFIDSLKLISYRNILQHCKEKGIQIIVVVPPYYVSANAEDASIVASRKVADSLNVPFLDFAEDSFYLKHGEWFSDYRHLNDQGVVHFNGILLHLLKSAGKTTP